MKSDPKLPAYSNFCKCTVCGEYFTSVYPFDMHRIGKHGDDRRCLTTKEMKARGMSKNIKGYWRSRQRA